MTSFLTKRPEDGIYDPSKRYAFTNITNEPFEFKWNGRPTTVKAHATIELPEYLAIHATGKLVDQIMQDEVNVEERTVRAQKGDPYWRSPKGISMGVPAARKPLEDKILRELQVDEESPQIALMRAEIADQIRNDMSAEKSSAPPVIPNPMSQPAEFADVKPK